MSKKAESFTVMWPADLCKAIAASGQIGKPIEVIFGGAHQSFPSLTRFKVEPGDFVYPVYVAKCVLYVIARMKVAEILPLDKYFAQCFSLPKKYLQWPMPSLLAVLRHEQPELGHRLPYGCVHEAAIGKGTPMKLDRAVPQDMLERIRYRSQRGERPIKHVEDGRLKHAISIHGGVYRLSPDSAKDFEKLVEPHRSTRKKK